MDDKLELLAKEIERHITQDGCACCRTKEYLATIKEILENEERHVQPISPHDPRLYGMA